MRALIVPRLLGLGLCADDAGGALFEPHVDLEQFVVKAIRVRNEIGARGIGHATGVSLGLTFSARDGRSGKESWFQGLGHARDNGERKHVAKAVAEWADGDSIAAHYGYGIDFFCSRDFGKNASCPSVLDPENRKWLSDTYGIRFVKLAELAEW